MQNLRLFAFCVKVDLAAYQRWSDPEFRLGAERQVCNTVRRWSFYGSSAVLDRDDRSVSDASRDRGRAFVRRKRVVKSIVVWILLLWTSLVMEQSRADLLPSGSLLFPVGVACLFWYRSGTGVVLAGFGFIVHWLLLQTRAPLDGAGMLLMSVVLLTRSREWSAASSLASQRVQHAWWLQPVLVVLVGTMIHAALAAAVSPARVTDMMGQRLVMAVFTIMLLTFVTRIADELGFRRRSEAF